MRGTTLNVLVQMLRRELRVAESPALGKNSHESYCHALRSAQDRLFTEHDWPNKNIEREILLEAGARYCNPPAHMDVDNIRSVSIYHNGIWLPVERGITDQDRNAYDPDADVRVDPVLMWALHNDETDNGDMIEVLPLPATNGGRLKLRGQRKLGALIANEHKCELDDLLIVLTAAADLCPAKEMDRYSRKAASHLFSLRRNLANNEMFVSGGGSDPNDRRVERPPIIVTGG